MIANEHRAAALAAIPVHPGVIVVGPEYQGIEGADRASLKEPVLQLGTPVIALEEQAKGVLGNAGIAARAAEDPDTAIDLETLASIGKDVLDRAGTLPVHSRTTGIRIDPLGTEDISDTGDDRHARQGAQPLPYTGAIGRVVGNLRIHLIVSPRRPGPARGKARRTDGLRENPV